MTPIDAYDTLKEYTGSVDLSQEAMQYPDMLNEVLTVLVGIPDLELEICGAWLWVRGSTYDHKATLKALGFRWAPKKHAWYFRPSDWRSRARGGTPFETIRARYGSYRPEKAERQAVAG